MSAPLADNATMDFQTAYDLTYEKLGAAKTYVDRGSRKNLDLDMLDPANASRTNFWRSLRPDVADVIKAIRDVIVASAGGGMLALLYHMACEYQTCVMMPNGTYHIANLAGKNTIMRPVTSGDWDKLLVFTQSVIHSNKFNTARINRTKRTKTRVFNMTTVNTKLQKAMLDNDQDTLGKFAACLIWMMETKNMNRSYVPDKGASIGGSFQFNKSTLLTRSYTPKPVEVVKEKAPEPEPDQKPAEEPAQKEEDIPENWEDLDF